MPRLATTNGHALPPFRRERGSFEAEITRARRYEHEVAILILELEAPAPLLRKSPNGKLPSADSDAFTVVGALLRHALRESDLAANDAERTRFVIALPQTNGRSGRVAARRLQTLVQERTLASLRAGVACFPVDGLILDDLVASAELGCRLGHGPLEPV